MSRVQIDNITIVNPKAAPCDPVRLAVTFSALTPLPRVLTWKVIYVGSAFSQEYDQVLEEFQIGPIGEPSTMSFTADCEPPDLAKIPSEQVLCTTALIISISYDQQQFARIGYYVLNAYTGTPEEAEGLSLQELLAYVDRIIIHEKPRVTKFEIQWEESEREVGKQKQEQGQIAEKEKQGEKAELKEVQSQPLQKKESQEKELKFQGDGHRSTQHPSSPDLQYGDLDEPQ